MKKTLLFLILFSALSFSAIQFIALPKAKNSIQNYLTSVGFKNAKINNIQFMINGINIPKITLDKENFNTASNIKAEIFWPSYLLNSKIKSIDVETLKISSVINNSKDVFAYKYIFNTAKINNLASQNIKIKKITWDIATPKSALRLEGDLTLKQTNNTKEIIGSLNAAQHELTLTSKWSGIIKSDGTFSVEGIYNGLGINTNALKLNRGTGWVTLNDQSKTKDIAAQLDAGSGNLFGVPIKNISFILSQDNESYPVSLRANAAGIDNVNLYGDFKVSPDIQKQSFDLALEMHNPNQFIHYLKQENVLKNNTIPKEYSKEETNIILAYKPENRFADGPFPFSLHVQQSSKNVLNGTFLIYPNNLDVRGTAQGEKDILSLLQTLFSIDEKNITDENIRFDENIKNLF